MHLKYLRQDADGVIPPTSFKFMMTALRHWYNTVIDIITVLPKNRQQKKRSELSNINVLLTLVTEMFLVESFWYMEKNLQ